MDCPRCGHARVEDTACPRCGVVFAKLRAAGARTPGLPSSVPPPQAAPPSARLPKLLGGLALFGLAVGAWRAFQPPPAMPPIPPPAPVQAEPQLDPVQVSAPTAPPPIAADPTLPPPSFALSREDRGVFDELHERVSRRAAIGEDDVREAEALYSRHPEEQGVQQLLGGVLLAAGRRDASGRRLDSALTRLRRAQLLLPGDSGPPAALVGLLLDSGDWSGAEAAARDLLGIERDQGVLERLAYALFRQDRNREASELLREALAMGPSPSARSLLERIEQTGADERGMTEQQLSHFHVRYDGDAHEDVGREILRVLERHYATLAGTLDHQPAAPIPVILFSRQQYHASGNPIWSGGVYEPIDGRIRIPIGGLTSSLTPELEQTLIHEVTHAFVGDRSRGVCPRDVNEGLAQYMEGKRIAELLDPGLVTALADGRIPGVAGFYLQALSLVEYLMGARGQGGINDLLREMAETRDVDEAFRRVYGSDQRATQRAWRTRLRQQHGS